MTRTARAELENGTTRLDCPCGGRAAIHADPETMERYAQSWLNTHAFCAIDPRVRARDAYRRHKGEQVRVHRCSRCDEIGHNRRSCPKPADETESA